MQVRRDRLRRLLIPKSQTLSGHYKISTKEKAFGYVLLMHAEIEAYMEDRISEIASRSFEVWKLAGKVSTPLLAMVCYREGGEIGFSENVFQVNSKRELESVVHSSKFQFDARVGANNGVRHKNLAKLFMSIGLKPPPTEEVILNALDGFGAKRGEYAHKSPTKRTLKQTDPITEANEIHALIENLAAFDLLFDKYCVDSGI